MHPVDARIAANMLDMAADEFSNHGCNDFELPNTPENYAFVQRLIASGDDPDDTPEVYQDQLFVMDWHVMRYCAQVLRQYARETQHGTT